MADICPPGSYCAEGSTTPTPCGPGYYSSAFGSSRLLFALSKEQWILWFAQKDNIISASFELFCDEGYMSGRKLHATNTDSPQSRIVLLESFKDRLDKPNCDQCSVGFSFVVQWPGSYCPLGSSSPVLCPSGIYNPLQQRTRLVSVWIRPQLMMFVLQVIIVQKDHHLLFNVLQVPTQVLWLGLTSESFLCERLFIIVLWVVQYWQLVNVWPDIIVQVAQQIQLMTRCWFVQQVHIVQ